MLYGTKLSLVDNNCLFVVEREELRSEEPASRWLSCIALLCQTFSKLRASDGQPLELLVKPLCQVLELCLSADAGDDELTCAATQVCVCSLCTCNTIIDHSLHSSAELL